MKTRLATVSLAMFLVASVNMNAIISPSRLSGFRNEMISTIYQDEYDAIWFIANGFIYRYNGQTAMLVSGPLPNGQIYGNAKGSIFAVSYNSILEIDTHSFQIDYHHPEGINYKKAILLCEGDSLWIASGRSLSVYYDGNIEKVGNTDSDTGVLVRLSDGRIVVGTAHGQVINISKSPGDVLYECAESITDLIEDSSGNLWVAAGPEVTCITKGQVFRLGGIVRSLLLDGDSNILAGCSNGIYRIGTDSIPEPLDIGAHNDTPITSLMLDKNQGIWIGTYYDGILYSDRRSLNSETIQGDFKFVKALLGSENDLWILTDGNGMYRVRNGRPQLIEGSKGIKFQCGYMEDGNIYCGVYLDGVYKYDVGKGKFSRIGFGGQKMTVLSIHKQQKDLYFCTNNGIFTFDPTSEKSISRRLPGLEKYCYSAVYDRKADRLWIGSDGLYYMDGGGETRRYTEDKGDPLFSKKCSSLSICTDGSLLFATTGAGIFKIDDEGATCFNKNNVSLPSDFIFQCLEANDSLIIAGYLDGLILLNTNSRSCNCFSESEDASVSSMRGGCLARIGDDGIYAGGKDGVLRISGNSLSFTAYNALFTIDRLFVNNSPYEIPLKGGLVLGHDETNFSFEISDFRYSDIPPSTIQYRLDGFDKEWKSLAGNRLITYMNIRPGKYTLQVRGAATSGGEYTCKRLEIRIKPTWYASTAAVIIWIMLIFAVTCWMLYILYTRIILRERLKIQERINKERNSLFINISHQLRTPLTIILGQMELFFGKNTEKFQGLGHIESSYDNAKKMRNIISRFVDMENTAEEENSRSSMYDELNITGLYSNDTKMLIVDDNAEIRLLLKSIFKERYSIVEAENGLQGLEMAKKENPDIIISDVMMPEMDGLEMTSKLKQDFATRHIPIILLTAHASERHNLEGLNLGADDYITKPFSNEILKARCRSLLRNREMMKERMKMISVQDGKSDAKSSKLINDFLGAIERHLPKPDVSLICRELGMSRTSLTEKIKKASGMTPREYIEDIKLKIAANMLLEGGYNISEISDRLGFNNPKYFTVRFHRKYGIAPSRYHK